jgi:hypothetical protein
VIGQLLLDLLEGSHHGKGFHIHQLGAQAGHFHHGHPLFHFFLAGGTQQDFQIIQAAAGRAQHLVIQIHFIQREGDDLVGFGLDHAFHVFGLADRYQQLFVDGHRGRNGDGDIPDRAAKSLPCFAQGLGNPFDIHQIAFGNGFLAGFQLHNARSGNSLPDLDSSTSLTEVVLISRPSRGTFLDFPNPS